MRAVVMHQTGGPEVLQVEEIEQPQPGDGEVLIAVRAASVNPIEWKFRRGLIPKDLPAVLGSDISGTIESSRADGFAAGEDVFGFAASGAYAEYAVTGAAGIAHKPDGVSHAQAAAIPVAGLTAWQGLFDKGELSSAQSVLIAGAAGGVGHFGVQLARGAGAHVIGIGSGRNRDFVLGLGAHDYVDYTQEDVTQRVSGVDLAFDTVGADTLTLLATVRDGGTLVTIAGAAPEQEAAERGVRAIRHVTSPRADQLERIAAMVAAGEVRVEIAEEIPLAEASRAHALSEAGHTRGKIVLAVS